MELPEGEKVAARRAPKILVLSIYQVALTADSTSRICRIVMKSIDK